MTNAIYTEYRDHRWGKVVFLTDGESSDAYSFRVRTEWKPDPEVGLAITLLNRSAGGDVLDLGANIGTWCLPTCLGTNNRFFAFEALPSNAKLLQLAINENNLHERLNLSQIAIWDSNTSLNFSGSSAYGIVDENGSINVPARSLDSLLDDGFLSRPSLIKMDIEGCELRAINGGLKLLERYHPDIIFEGNGAHCVSNGYFPQDIIGKLVMLGYKVYAIVNNKLVLMASNSFQPFGLVNYLATTSRYESFDGFEMWSIPIHIALQKVDTALNKMKPGYKKFMILQAESARFDIPNEILGLVRKHADI
jgi:FkbM family methyltransferase